MIMRRFLIFSLCIFYLIGCANSPTDLGSPTVRAGSTPVQDGEPESDLPQTAKPVTSPTGLIPSGATPDGPRKMRIWVPPQFDPAADTLSGQLLQDRLDEFVTRRPGLQIEVRVKAESGTGGLLEALIASNAAAEVGMPDLIALPRTDLESAAQQGLLHPLDGLTTYLDDPDWYPYSQQLARIQNTTFGLPFAGDALVLVGYSEVLPTNWDDLKGEILVFPGASPLARFSLNLYMSEGGILVNEEGRHTIDETLMSELLTFYSDLVKNGNLSANFVTMQDDSAAWEAFNERRATFVVTWTSIYLLEKSASHSLAPVPGIIFGPANSDSTAMQINLIRGYSWALAGSNSDNQSLAVELAEFLSAAEFLAEWTEASGMLPTRPTVLDSWEDTELQNILGQIAESAQLVPGNDLSEAVGPIFQNAIAAVISGEKTPEQAAGEAIELLK